MIEVVLNEIEIVKGKLPQMLVHRCHNDHRHLSHKNLFSGSIKDKVSLHSANPIQVIYSRKGYYVLIFLSSFEMALLELLASSIAS